MKKSKISVLFLLLLLMSLLMGCGETSTSQPTGEKKLFTLRTSTPTNFSDTLIADQLGFFKDEGIQIKYIGALGQGVSSYQAIEQGDIDFFWGGHMTDLAKARLAGLTPVAVTPGFVDDPTNSHVYYLVANDSPIKSIADFAGKKVGISANGVCIDGFIKKYFKDHGLDDSTIQYVTLPQPGQMEQAVVNHLIDVTTSHNPYFGVALATGGVRQVGSSYDIVGTAAAGLSVRGFSDKFIKEHPDVVQGFVNALYRARMLIISDLPYAKKVLAKSMGLKPEQLSSNSFTDVKTIPREWVDLWFNMSEDLGYWKHGDITPGETYTDKFVPKDPPASDAKLGKESAT